MFRIIFRVLLITIGFCIGVNSYSQIQKYKAKTVAPYKAKTIAPVTSTHQAKLNNDKIPNSESGNINFFIRNQNSCNRLEKKNRQVTYIAPLNHIPLLSSDPGGVLQELAV